MIENDLQLEDFFTNNSNNNYKMFVNMKIEEKLVHFISKVLRLVDYKSNKIEEMTQILKAEELKSVNYNYNGKGNSKSKETAYNNIKEQNNNFVQFGVKRSLPVKKASSSEYKFNLDATDFDDYELYLKMMEIKYLNMKREYDMNDK